MQSSFEQTIKNFLPSGDERLDSLLKFSALAEEMDKISRRTKLADGSRRQNDAEHSWRIALMALMFKDCFDGEVDATRAAAICVTHDLVEIYAGDTFAYDAAANVGKEEREKMAADKLFGQLPDDVSAKLRALWNEFEEMKTPESRYANCMDRLEPFLNNTLAVDMAAVEKRAKPIKENMSRVWKWLFKSLERGAEQGWIKK